MNRSGGFALAVPKQLAANNGKCAAAAYQEPKRLGLLANSLMYVRT